jgi:hypothetical protein
MKKILTACFYSLMLTVLVSGCASTRRVDSEVTSFARWSPAPPAPGSFYRFERLPSQQQPDVQQTKLEAQAQTALAKVGLQFSPQTAAFSVLIGNSIQSIPRSRWDGSAYERPNIFIGSSIGSGGSSFGLGFGFPLVGMEPQIYRREVGIVIRELRSNSLVYETRAYNDDTWNDSDRMTAALFDAALSGFPLPPAGPRRISTEIPR